MVYSKVNKVCTICQSEYLITKGRAESSKFCSKQCWAKRNPPQLVKCKNCDNKFLKRVAGKKAKVFCSYECRKEWNKKYRIGENHPAFKDGKSMERDRARLSPKIKEWRDAVFARDNYTCQDCGSKTELQAHHIIEWAKDVSKRFDVNNGQTLCIICHGKVHSRDFTKRLNKFCIDCGKKIKKPMGRCRKCSSRERWKITKAA